MQNASTDIRDWRCHACGKLLGKRQGNQIHIQYKHGVHYIVDTKITGKCPCGALNAEQPVKTVSQQKL